MRWYLLVWKKFAQFDGRSRRAEYWYFTLFNFLIFFVFFLGFLLGVALASQRGPSSDVGVGIIYFCAGLHILYGFVILIPSIAVTVRRLHDTGRSGLWFLFNFIPFGPIVLLIFLVQDSEPGTNDYGPNPKYDEDAYGDSYSERTSTDDWRSEERRPLRSSYAAAGAAECSQCGIRLITSERANGKCDRCQGAVHATGSPG